jgi:ubiquinone/menaquinone biosynthesis C-methylase UbiE
VATELKNLLISYIHDRELKRLASSYLRGSMIDIGCGEKPYKALLSPHVTRHVGLDHIDSLHDKSNVDLFGTAYEIPAEDNSFDSAICTAVLEHLE